MNKLSIVWTVQTKACIPLLAGKGPCTSERCRDRCKRDIALRSPHNPVYSHTGMNLCRCNVCVSIASSCGLMQPETPEGLILCLTKIQHDPRLCAATCGQGCLQGQADVLPSRPGVFMHLACGSQLCDPLIHSSSSLTYLPDSIISIVGGVYTMGSASASPYNL